MLFPNNIRVMKCKEIINVVYIAHIGDIYVQNFIYKTRMKDATL
jgi:hypothetical protein